MPTPMPSQPGYVSVNANTGARTRGGYGVGGNIDPVDVTNPTPNLNNYQQFADDTWSQFTRNLDPQWQQNEARFNQDMVNRGFAQGSEGYTAARSDFDRGRNDAYTSGNIAANQAALGAQNQFWGQNYQESALANALAQSRMGADASMYGADASAGASMYGNDINRLNFTDNLGFQRERADMTDLMGLYGMGNDQTAYNNNLLNQDYGRGSDFMSMIPGLNPQGLNVSGALNSQQNANNQNSQNQYNAELQQQQQQQQLMMTIASMFASSRTFKDSLGPLEPHEALAALVSLPVDRWQYHGDAEIHVGPYAEDFNKAVTGQEKKTINVIDMLGTIVSGMQALAAEVRELKAARHA